MQSILTVTQAATSYDLTELQDVKDELGVSNNISNTILARYISSASLAAQQYCNRIFAVEAVSEQFFPNRVNRFIRGGVKPLQLMRWPLVTVTSVTEDSILLVENTDYIVDKVNGQLTRIDSSGIAITWHPLPLVVVYSAGFAIIPLDVEDAIIRMVSRRFASKGRDPNLKQQSIPGVLEQSWWISTGSDSGNMDPSITDILDNYRMPLAA